MLSILPLEKKKKDKLNEVTLPIWGQQKQLGTVKLSVSAHLINWIEPFSFAFRLYQLLRQISGSNQPMVVKQ